MSQGKGLDEAIAREAARLAELEKQVEEARALLRDLRAEHAALGPVVRDVSSTPSPSSGGQAPRTPAEKLALFQGLFRGREDVFARLWVNPRKGKKGYAPACANEWVGGVCDKRHVRCGECPNQAFLPLDGRQILDHLRGQQVIGIYPLLEDETCWLLAADFDGPSWPEDVAAFVESSRALGLEPAVERSRSGVGAHVWFFFSAPVPAREARRMGCHIITGAMSRRHQIPMASYDRLFPNQDTMPRGGFGNLIALPFQDGPRREGNTVFLDQGLAPHPDQWAFLASVPLIQPGRVASIGAEAARRGLVVGVRVGDFGEDEEGAEPWTLPPSGKRRVRPITEPLPPEVRAVLAQRLFVDKEGLPSSLLNRIKRLAAFQNPEFYRRQAMRLSTALTPRVIACAEEFPGHIALPRGCRTDLEGLLEEHGVALAVEDQRVDGAHLDLRFRGRLTPEQERAVRALLGHDMGLLVAPPGAGKTVVGTWMAARRGRGTLVLVHRRQLLDQWRAQLALFLGIDPKEVGQIGAGRRKPNGRLDVAMIQSLVRRGSVQDEVAGYGHVIVDECHHLPAVSFERVLAEVKARHVLGLTATPRRRDGHHPIIEMQCGPVRFAVAPGTSSPFRHRLVVRETGFRLEGAGEGLPFHSVYRSLARDAQRNRLIVADVMEALREGRTPILLTERREHLDRLAAILRDRVPRMVVLRGGMTAPQHREAAARMAEEPDGTGRLLLATGRYAGEGFDDPRLDTLFLAMPISWRGTLVQYTGRLHRPHPGKTEVRIYDYVDREVPALARMFQKRLRAYRSIGYDVGDTLPDF